MDEPTDRALKIQGINRHEYDALSKEGKSVIAGRSRRLTELADIALAAEILNHIAETDESSKGYILEALEGKHPEFAENVRKVIRDYLDSEVDSSIKDFYRIKYGSKGIIASAQEEALIKDEVRGDIAPQREEPTPHIEPQPAPEPTMPQPEPTAAPPLQTKPPQANTEQRRMNIAMILSQWEKRDVNSVMKTDADVIRDVIELTNQYQAEGITDESVCKAAEAMIKSKTNDVQFYREALIEPNREILLMTAKTFLV